MGAPFTLMHYRYNYKVRLHVHVHVASCVDRGRCYKVLWDLMRPGTRCSTHVGHVAVEIVVYHTVQ